MNATIQHPTPQPEHVREVPDVDPMRWPHTSTALYFVERETEAVKARVPALAWAWGNILDRAECRLMGGCNG